MWSVYLLEFYKKKNKSLLLLFEKIIHNFLKNIKNNKRLFLYQIMGRVEGLLLFFYLLAKKNNNKKKVGF